MLIQAILLITSTIAIVTIYKIYSCLFYFETISFDKNTNQRTNKKNILLINSIESGFGGGPTHMISIYKNLIKNGHNVQLLAINNSDVSKQLKQLKIPHHVYNKIIKFKNTIQPGLYSAIFKICKKENIQIINCNLDKELRATKKIANKLPVKIILTHHSHNNIQYKYLNNISLDGAICVHHQLSQNLKIDNQNKNLKIKHILSMPPFFEEDRFLNFTTQNSRKVFFEQEFGIKIKDLPIICMIANMYKDITHKNHPLLIKAAHKLIHEKNKPVQVVLVGDGDRKNEIEKLVKSLDLKDYIHFTGLTDKTPEILFHSDIKALVSRNEAFGIVIMEAALLKKPIICAHNTGAYKAIKQDYYLNLIT